MEVWGEEKVSWPLSLWDSMLDKADYISRRKSLFLFIPIHHSTCTLMERIRFDFLFYLETVNHSNFFMTGSIFREEKKLLAVAGICVLLLSSSSDKMLKMHQEFPSCHPMLPNFGVQMGSGVSNMARQLRKLVTF